MPERVNGGLALAAIGAVALLVSLFLNWYEPNRSAWTVFELNDLVLAALALLVLGIAVADVAARADTRYVPEGSVLYAGIGALIIIVANLIQPPPAALHDSLEVGAWIGLVGAILITVGGVLLRARIAVVITTRSREGSSTRATTTEPDAARFSQPATPPEGTETRPLPRERH